MTALALLAVGVFTVGSGAFDSIAGQAVQDRVISDPRIAESSGLAASSVHDGVVWTVNDSGDDAVVYAVDWDGATVAVCTLVDDAGVPLDARDVEAVAPLPGGGLVVADIGDNRVRRESVVLRVLDEPDPLQDGPVRARSLRVSYPEVAADAETLLIDGASGRWFVVTKQLVGAQVFEVPPAAVEAVTTGDSPAETAVLQRIGGLQQGLVTDGAVLPDGRVVLRDYRRAVLYQPVPADGWGDEVTEIATPAAPQAESLAATPDGTAVLVGSEGAGSVVWRVPVPPAPTPPPSAATEPAETPASDRRVRLLLAGAGAVVGIVALSLLVRRRRR